MNLKKELEAVRDFIPNKYLRMAASDLMTADLSRGWEKETAIHLISLGYDQVDPGFCVHCGLDTESDIKGDCHDCGEPFENK